MSADAVMAASALAPPLDEAVRALSSVESQEAILRLAAFKSGETRTECAASWLSGWIVYGLTLTGWLLP